MILSRSLCICRMELMRGLCRGGRNWRNGKREGSLFNLDGLFFPRFTVFMSEVGVEVEPVNVEVEVEVELVMVGLDEWEMYDSLGLGEPTRFFFCLLCCCN